MVSYRSMSTLPQSLRSLSLLTDFWSLNLVLHDNSFDAEATQLAQRVGEEFGFPVNAIMCADNCGFAAACNISVATSNDDFYLFINPDAAISIWPNAWRPTPGIWGPRIIDQCGRPQRLSGKSRTPLDEVRNILRLSLHEPQGAGYVSGASLLIDAESFGALGGFDEAFFMYYEDIDMGVRAGPLGIPVNVKSEWTVRHIGGVSANHDNASRVRSMRSSAHSSLYFHKKHGHNWRGFGLMMQYYFAIRGGILCIVGRKAAASRFRTWSALYRHEMREH